MKPIRGIRALDAKLTRIRTEIPGILKDEVEVTGRLTELGAKQAAPVDMGKLRQSITYEPFAAGFGARITANVSYSPFVEFGTGGLVEIPQGWEELAAGFRGKGIRTVNLPASPFLIPPFRKQVDDFYRRINQRYNNLIR